MAESGVCVCVYCGVLACTHPTCIPPVLSVPGDMLHCAGLEEYKLSAKGRERTMVADSL